MHLLIAKAKGSIDALERTPDRDRRVNASISLGDNYNSLRKLVVDQHSDLLPYLPPEGTVVEFSFGQRAYEQTINDILVFTREIYGLLLAKDSNTLVKSTVR